MRITLTVIAGPHAARAFAFDRHDTFLVGRSRHAHFQLPAKDRYFSRIHFMIEVNPPACRLIDIGSHNGTYVNDARVLTADLRDGDRIRAGHTVLRLGVHPDPDPAETVDYHPEAPPAPSPGGMAPVPGYALLRPLGEGALGTTYLAQRLAGGAQVAVKLVRPDTAPTPQQADEFLRAARYLLRLDHPHLVPLLDLGLGPQGLYFIAGYVPGPSARDVVQRDGPLPVRRAVDWAAQVLQALAYAHARHFVHRDVKPTNLLVAPEGGKDHVRLADFGLARAYQAAPFSGLSVTRDVLGAAAYLPPETLLNFQEVHPAADQYAAAATLYYLLTGAAPLEMPGEAHRRLSTVLRQNAVPIRDRRTDVPAALADAIQRALSRLPGQRFKDVAEFRHALVTAVQGG